jgi:hypothetical protein
MLYRTPVLLAAAVFIVAACIGAAQWRSRTAEREQQARVVAEILALQFVTAFMRPTFCQAPL